MVRRNARQHGAQRQPGGQSTPRDTPCAMPAAPAPLVADRFAERIREFRRMRVGDLLPHPGNHKRHGGDQLAAISGLLARYGKVGALLAFPADGRGPDGDFSTLMLWDGHGRQTIHPDETWWVAVTDLTRVEADNLVLTFDETGRMAELDPVKTRLLMDQMPSVCAELDAMLADMWGEIEADAVAAATAAAPVEEDEAPEPQAAVVTRPGDLWTLGRHRLLAGDCRKPEDVARVMGGEPAACIFTDPPYGVSQAAKNRMLNECAGGKGGDAGRNESDIPDDDLSPAELKEQLLVAFNVLREHVMADDCTLFVTAPQGGELCMMMMMMQEACLRPRHVLIWKKNCPTFSMGRLDYDYQHEPILLTWGKRHKRPMAGTHKTSVWEVDKSRESKEHPTMKPVELYVNAYLNNSDAGDIVFDGYAGSGTAFIAAEHAGRVCRGLELLPKFCDVICRRFAAKTGQQAVRQDGVRFGDLQPAKAAQ